MRRLSFVVVISLVLISCGSGIKSIPSKSPVVNSTDRALSVIQSSQETRISESLVASDLENLQRAEIEQVISRILNSEGETSISIEDLISTFHQAQAVQNPSIELINLIQQLEQRIKSIEQQNQNQVLLEMVVPENLPLLRLYLNNLRIALTQSEDIHLPQDQLEQLLNRIAEVECRISAVRNSEIPSHREDISTEETRGMFSWFWNLLSCVSRTR